MATYLFSENRELKNIQDGDVVVNDCEGFIKFKYYVAEFAAIHSFNVSILTIKQSAIGCIESITTAHFTRIQAEPQTAPDIPVPCRSN